MHALVATYPQSEGPERAGALAGEKAALRPPAAASPFFAQFDTDGDGLISYEEFLLVMSFLAILPEVRAFALPVTCMSCPHRGYQYMPTPAITQI